MAHDPRAPRIAAVATLLSAALLLLTAINLNVNLIGSGGMTDEEYVALAVVIVLLLVRFWANRELEVPEFTPRSIEANQDFTPVSFRTDHHEAVNPTTQSIITDILGQTASATPDVNAAMATLGVANASPSTAVAAPVAQRQSPSENAMNYSTQIREALPADPMDGRTVHRNMPAPVPLPGQRMDERVDPTTLPGLESHREFVTEGVGLVPLPQSERPDKNTKIATEQPSEATVVPPLDLPSVNDLFMQPTAPANASPAVAPLDLPSIDDLFEASTASRATTTAEVPALPNLDDLF